MRGRRALIIVLTTAAIAGGAGCGDDAAPDAVADGEFSVAAATAAGGGPGIWVTTTGEVTVAADRAFVVTVAGGDELALPVAPLSGDTREQLRTELAAAGFEENAVVINTGQPGQVSPGSVWVEVPVEDLPDAAERVRAVTERIVDGGVTGLRFALSDCGPALRSARDDALDRARTRAGELAKVAKVEIGDIVYIEEIAMPDITQVFGTGNPCATDPTAADVLDTFIVPPEGLDAEAEVEVYVNLGVGFAIGSVPDRVVVATGEAAVEGPADRAELFFIPAIQFDVLGDGGTM